MSTYDDASLVLIPSGYKNGIVFSQKPMDANGQMTFTRASSATRVQSDGLIEKVRTNLALYSEQFDDAYWSKSNAGTGVVPVVTANTTAAPDGTTTADTIVFDVGAGTTTSDRTFVRRAFTTTTGVEYGSSIYLRGSVGGEQIVIKNAANEYILATLTTSWQRFESIASATGAMDFEFGIRQGLGGIGTINATATIYVWGAQLETGVPTDYIATTTAAVSVGPVSGLPRLDYLNSTCPKLLLEPQRSNLALQSEQMDNAAWTKNDVTVSANAIASPDGYTNADKIVETATTAVHRVYEFINVTSGTTYTQSIFAKAAERTSIAFEMRATSTVATASFDLVNGTATGTGASIVDYGNGWYRCILTAAATATGTGLIMTYVNAISTYAGNASSGVYLWGFQFEAGAYASSYIPTLGASVTRVADAALKTGISSLIGQTEGTLFAEFNARSLSETRRVLTAYADGNNFIMLTLQSTNVLRFLVFAGGAIQADFTTPIVNGNVKIAGAYKANDFVFYVNGVQRGTDTSGTVPATSSVYVGYDVGGTLQLADGISQALIFKTRLDNATLQSLTTL